MARSSQRNSARTRRSMRSRRRPAAIRRLSKQLTLQPYKCRIPGDPPSVLKTLQFSGRLTAVVAAVPNGTSDAFTVLGNGDIQLNIPFDSTKAYLQNVSVTWSTLLLMSLDFMRISVQSGNSYEMCLHKVQLWGPTDSQWPSAHLGLSVDLGQPFGALAARDVGTQTQRPKIGISIPQRAWFGGGNTTPVIIEMDPLRVANKVSTAVPSGNTTNIGEFHISYTIRISDGIPTAFTGKLPKLTRALDTPFTDKASDA